MLWLRLEVNHRGWQLPACNSYPHLWLLWVPQYCARALYNMNPTLKSLFFASAQIQLTSGRVAGACLEQNRSHRSSYKCYAKHCILSVCSYSSWVDIILSNIQPIPSDFQPKPRQIEKQQQQHVCSCAAASISLS